MTIRIIGWWLSLILLCLDKVTFTKGVPRAQMNGLSEAFNRRRHVIICHDFTCSNACISINSLSDILNWLILLLWAP